jgi:RNA polymerase sigma-70 factor (ECF subfamily)
LTGSRADAEDLAHDTLVRALEKKEQVRDPEAMPGWLASIQRTVYLNERRTPRARLELLRVPEPGSEPRGDLAAELEARGLSDEMAAALASLPAEWREALLLREVDELSYEEIARAQRCPIGTVRSRLARARAAMLDALQEAHHERVYG